MQRPLVSSKTVILKIVRDLGLGSTEIPWQDLVEWIGEGLQHIGAFAQFEERSADLEVDGYRAKLPCDFYAARPNNNLAYRISGDNLTVGFPRGVITGFAYLAFPVDEEGFPLVPDNISYATALFWKVAMQLAIRGDLVNKTLTYPICKDRWSWYCKQAGTQGSGFGAETAQRMAGLFTARIPDLTQYEQGFAAVNATTPPTKLRAVSNLPLGAVIPKQWTPAPTPAADPNAYVS